MTATFRFCPVCGTALEPRVLRGGEPARLVCTSRTCGFVFYLDPKVAAGTIIRDADGSILLLRRAIEPGYGLWVFPGGYVDRGEDVRLAARREAREEAGLDVRLDDLVGVFSYAGTITIIIVWTATALSHDVVIDDESLEYRWFTPAAVPWD
ncbi:MAG: NUDIX hydrolase, partial [Acidobacteria bacterium]|nr:NUDIX hydrolase [Acidobacteriota bacterium]